MAVRNLKDVGVNLKKIMSRLINNDNLVNLLYYTDPDPLSKTPLTAEQKKELIFNKLIKIIPRVGPKDTSTSIITIRVMEGRKNGQNNEFKNLTISIESFVPLEQWIIKDTNLRPFAIMGEIQSSLDKTAIEGLGKLSGGDFQLDFLTDEISSYEQIFEIISYD